MRMFTVNQPLKYLIMMKSFYTLLFLGSALSACKQTSGEPEVIIDPVEKMASISVLRATGSADAVTQLKIDGLYG